MMNPREGSSPQEEWVQTGQKRALCPRAAREVDAVGEPKAERG